MANKKNGKTDLIFLFAMLVFGLAIFAQSFLSGLGLEHHMAMMLAFIAFIVYKVKEMGKI